MNCEVCNTEAFKYKCPKCQLKYCSLGCYKQHRVIHEQAEAEKKNDDEESNTANINSTSSVSEPTQTEPGMTPAGSKVESTSILPTPEYQNLIENNTELKQLLSYTTVRYHLNKVHKILSIQDGATNAVQDTEKKQQLAVDYLNTLRNGGIHYNEAVEEFVQVFLSSCK